MLHLNSYRLFNYLNKPKLETHTHTVALLLFTETVADPTPTLQGDNQDTLSGEGAYEVTTKDPFQDMTESVLTFEYEDTTHSQAVDEEESETFPITSKIILKCY